MNPADPSPATKTTSDTHNPLINQLQQPDVAQNMSFSGHFRAGQGMNSFSNQYLYSDQPPSMGAVRPVVVSNPSGGGLYYASGQPPSLSDVGRRETSLTGQAFTGDPVSGEALPGMSLTASSFRMYNPNAFQKDNDGY